MIRLILLPLERVEQARRLDSELEGTSTALERDHFGITFGLVLAQGSIDLQRSFDAGYVDLVSTRSELTLGTITTDIETSETDTSVFIANSSCEPDHQTLHRIRRVKGTTTSDPQSACGREDNFT
ncbi:hypothetical protein P3342_009440 [Pyrenophora teres f. teres]|nr:hypothetical protein P3342_009440 [Pyrenophora teres f. teres]